MNYYTKRHTENDTKQITKEEARYFLKGAYVEEAVDDIIDNNKSFRLRTPYRDIWTVTDDRRTPMAGFYGIVGD